MRRPITTILVVFMCAYLEGADTRRVAFIYDERHISDADRAALYEVIIAATPLEQWRNVTVPTAQKVETVVDSYYDYWSKIESDLTRDHQFPYTTAVLVKSITAANPGKVDHERGIKPGTAILIPPLPVRGQTAALPHRAPRQFDVQTASYTRMTALAGALPEDQSGSMQPMKSVRQLITAHELDRTRNVNSTSIVVDADRVAKVMSAGGLRIPEGVAVLRSISGRVELVFPASADTTVPLSWPVSAHGSYAAAEWSRERNRLSELLQREWIEPLWIIDWWDTPTTGHGERVRSVVDAVLTDLGLYNELHAYVRTFDLNPRNNRAELTTILNAYKSVYTADSMSDAVAEDAMTNARDWLASDPVSDLDEARQMRCSVDEFVLQSVLWSFLGQKTSVLNFSWVVNGPQLTVFVESLLKGSQSFGVVAAGNDRYPVAADSYPQSRAAVDKKFVNVTYATADGEIRGAVGGSGRVPVHVAAKGGGFEHGAIRAGDTGSSYASPYVATYAWLRTIFENVSAETLRQDLIEAAMPAANMPGQVTSGGLFEPELLFVPASLEPHIVINGETRSLVGACIEVKYANDGGGVTHWSVEATHSMQHGRLSVYQDTRGTYWLWRRSNEGDHPVDAKPVLSIEVTFSNHERIPWRPDQFAEQVSDLCF